MRRLILLLVLVAIAAAGWVVRRQLAQLDAPYRGFAGEEQFVEVPSGTGPQAIGRLLVRAGVVSDLTTWRLAVWRSGRATALKAGEYRFVEALSPAAVVEKLARGDVYLRSITFPEGLTIKQMAAIFEQSGFGPARDFVHAARNTALVAAFDPAAGNLEGYLFPDTYALPRRATASDLVQRMVEHFESVMTAELRQAADAAGLSVREAVSFSMMEASVTASRTDRPAASAAWRSSAVITDSKCSTMRCTRSDAVARRGSA
jgi:UPF0755 protein